MRGKMGFAGILALAAAVAARAQGDQWNDVVKRANAAEIAGDYAVAAAAYREASQLSEAFAPADARRVYAFNAEAMMYDAMGRFANAEMAYRRALAVMDLFDWMIVVLQRANADALAAWQPFGFLADANAARDN